MAALAVARGAFQPDRTPRPSAPPRPRDAGQFFPAVARRAPAAGAPLLRLDSDGFRAATFPAARRADVLLQQLEVPLSICEPRRDARQTPARPLQPAEPR